AALATVLAALLVVVQPFAGRRRYRALLARLATDPGARLRHYRRGIRGEWLGVALVGVIGLLAGRTAASIGLRAPDDAALAWQLVAEVAVLLAASTVVMRRPGFLDLLPRTTDERLVFAVLAITAGVCEEVLFRGFGFAYVRFVWPGASDTAVIVLTSVPFGFAHLYQGVRGVVLTGLVGAAFASMVLATGSLLVPIAAHAMVDLRILALPQLAEEAPRPAE